MTTTVPPCLLLLFLMMSGFPVMTSLPASPTARQERLLNYLDSSQELSDLQSHYTAYLQQQQQHQPTHIVETDVLHDVEEAEAEAEEEDAANASPGPEHAEVVRRTREMRSILDVIYQRILELEQHKEAFLERKKQEVLLEKQRLRALLERQRLYESLKRGPNNHFLRIGRGGTGLNHELGSDHLPDGPEESSRLSDDESSPVTHNLQELILQELKDHDDFKADVDEFVKHDSFSDSQNDVLLSRRGFGPQNSFVRIGRTAFSPRNKFVRLGRSGKGDLRDGMEESFPVVRRSYIRIGRLPASVFRRRQAVNAAGADDRLSDRRSPGYRLTKSGVMRAGKRS